MKDYEKILKHQDLFNRYLAQEQCILSAFHFSSIFAWSDFFDFTFEEINQRLCVFAKNESGSFLYLPPLGGPIELSTIHQCFERMGKTSIQRRVARIENVPVSGWPLGGPPVHRTGANPALEDDWGVPNGQDPRGMTQDSYRLTGEKKADEYIYRKEDIINLTGTAYKSQRHDINHLLKQDQPICEPYREEKYLQCLDLYEHWAAERSSQNSDPIYQSMLQDNHIVHALIFKYHKRLGLTGRVVLIENRVVAYSFGYPLNSSTFCVLLEVTNLMKPGLAAFMFKNFCADDMWKSYQFVNAMDDFGMPNVARAKKAYHPVELIPSYTIYPRVE